MQCDASSIEIALLGTAGEREPADAAPLLCVGRSSEGLPVAVQLVARYGDEATPFRLSGQLEQALPWFARKPPTSKEHDATSTR